MEKRNFAVWLAVNEDGDAAVSLDGATEVKELLNGDAGGDAIRTVKLNVTMALPKVIEADIDVADDAGEIEQVEAA